MNETEEQFLDRLFHQGFGLPITTVATVPPKPSVPQQPKKADKKSSSASKKEAQSCNGSVESVKNEIKRLLDCYNKFCLHFENTNNHTPIKTTSAPLQHECTNQCDWFYYDMEWAVCIRSGNLHECVLGLCQHRVAGQEEGHEVCTLTARIREESEYVTSEYDRKGTAYHASIDGDALKHAKLRGLAKRQKVDYNNYYAHEREASIILQQLLPSVKSLDTALIARVADVCVRLFRIIETKSNFGKENGRTSSYTFQDHCIIVIYMMQTGMDTTLRTGKKGGEEEPARVITVIPKEPFIHEHIIPSSDCHLSAPTLKYKTQCLKTFRGAISTVDPDVWDEYELQSSIRNKEPQPFTKQ